MRGQLAAASVLSLQLYPPGARHAALTRAVWRPVRQQRKGWRKDIVVVRERGKEKSWVVVVSVVTVKVVCVSDSSLLSRYIRTACCGSLGRCRESMSVVRQWEMLRWILLDAGGGGGARRWQGRVGLVQRGDWRSAATTK
jgi:hypothetical protein